MSRRKESNSVHAAANSSSNDARSFGKAELKQGFQNLKYSLHPAPEPGRRISHSQPPVWGGVLCADVMRYWSLSEENKMGIINRLLGQKKSSLDERIAQLSQAILKKASDQSWDQKIIISEEARMIGTSCGILSQGLFKKQHHPANFVDIAFWLMCYPPELAFSIATQFTNFASHLGWNPFGTIMVSLSQIDSLYRGMFTRASLFREKPELFEIINNKPLRLQKAGRLLAVSILASSQTIKQAKTIYRNQVFDPSVKAILDEELKGYGEEMAREIIK